jgi:peptidoglycan-associated lipoprotein
MRIMKNHSPLLIIAAAAFLAACATTKSSEKKSSLSKDKVDASSTTAEAAPTAPPADVTEASLKTGGDFALRDDLKNVPFDYDSAKLSDEALAILKANAEIIKGDAALDILVAGNCDERGTTAYNLALGQKRAKEVRDYYIRLGVDGGRVATISYGKEQPLCTESNDACWSKNRRAESRARNKAAKAAPAQ